MMDKNEIIERLEMLAGHAVHTVGEPPFVMSLDDGVAIHEAIDMLRSQPEPHWIPCSERFPKDFEDVLVWYEYFRYGEYNRMYQTWDVGYYNSQLNIWGGGVTGQKVRAIAWKPLPEPYEEEKHG